MTKTKDPKKDFFYATLKGDELTLEPYCACGNYLLEGYFCEKCKRQCVCTEIRCRNNATLEYVNRFIENNESFKKFTAVLDEGTKEGND